MMFTEKILQRKNAGHEMQPVAEEGSDDDHDEGQASIRGPMSRFWTWCWSKRSAIEKKVDGSNNRSHKRAPPASLGKILNIMRCVILRSRGMLLT